MAPLTALLDELDRAAASIQLARGMCAGSGSANLSNAEFVELIRSIESVGRGADLLRVDSAAEVARRSGSELGYSGLAVQSGHRTAEAFLASVTGVGRADATRRLAVGTAMHKPAFKAVAAGLRNGDLALDQAHAIVGALDELVGTADPAKLGQAVDSLVDSAIATAPHPLSADPLGVDARAARDDLRAVSALDAEAALRSQRYLRIGREIDGMRRIHGLLDPESSAVLIAAVDAATNPRRGGPRMVDKEDQLRAQRLESDERTDDQLRLDVVIDLVRVASAVGHKPVLGSARPAVRVVITMRDLESATGSAHIDGVETPISAQTARRMACDAGYIPVVLGSNSEVLDIGVAARPFTPAQRVALAVRDGGCRWFDCYRPPSWCEAHHMEEWSLGGPTSVDNGMLLCRHHHLLLHNNGWQATRVGGELGVGGELCVIPPPGKDPTRTPILLPTKSRAAAAAAAARVA